MPQETIFNNFNTFETVKKKELQVKAIENRIETINENKNTYENIHKNRSENKHKNKYFIFFKQQRRFTMFLHLSGVQNHPFKGTGNTDLPLIPNGLV